MLAVLSIATTASAATIRVSTRADQLGSGSACSLREAIFAANLDSPIGGCHAGSGNDTVSVPRGTYRLALAGAGEDIDAAGDRDVTGTLSIVHRGSSRATIDARGLDRVIDVHAGARFVRISGLTLTGGVVSGSGGGVSNTAAVLILSNSTLLANHANGSGQGGGCIAAVALRASSRT